MKLHLIYAGYGVGKWTLREPFHVKRLLEAPPGISGTELQLFGHARQLAQRGHEVSVYSRFVEECEVDGVRYRELDTPHERCDVAIAYHDGRPLEGWNASFKVAMHQTFLLSNRQQDATYTGADFADRYFSATEHCARFLEEKYGFKVGVIPNAWDLGEFKPWAPVPGRMVFTTSIDRGGHRLVEALPEIRKLIPEAHVVMLRRGSPGLLGLEGAGVPGLEFRGPLGRNETLALLATASCYAYPCDPPSPCEVFPVSMLEACATGVPVVLAPADGIEKVFEPGVWLTPPVKDLPTHRFIDAVATVLSNALMRHQYSKRAMAWAAGYMFEKTTTILCRELGL